MPILWLVICEVLFEPGDLPLGDTKGFMRVTMWGDSEQSLRSRLAECLESYRWHLISIESASPINEDSNYPEEVAEMVDRTRGNPEAIIVGRVFSYKEE
jgi:hypothetical protein